MSDTVNLWPSPEHALAYLERRDTIPHRTEGYAVLLEMFPPGVQRVLDIGTGDGVMLALVRSVYPRACCVGMDFSPTMLEAARTRFAGESGIELIEHNFDDPLPELGEFDLVVSSFAIHHAVDSRQRALYAEIYDRLRDAGFIDVDCQWKWRELALLVGSKPV